MVPLVQSPIIWSQSPINWDHPLNAGLVACWRVLPRWMGGARWWDLVGRAPAAMTGQTWGTTPRSGGIGEMRFNGTTTLGNIGALTRFDFPNTTFTIAGWARFTASVTQYIIAKRLSAGLGGYFIRVDSTGLTVRILDANNTIAGQRSSTTTTLMGNGYFHFVVTLTTNTTTLASNDVEIYLNGLLNQGARSDSAFGPYAVCTGPLVLGALSELTAGFITGALDDIRIYNRRLSAQEARGLHRESQRWQQPLLLTMPLSLFAPTQAVATKAPPVFHRPLRIWRKVA